MIARRLKVYKATYELVKALSLYQKEFERQFKYTLGERLQSTAIGLFQHLQRANMYPEYRQRYLEAFVVEFETLKTLMRLAFDFGQIGKQRQAHIFKLCDSIGRQVSAWKNSERAKASDETRRNGVRI